MVTTCDVEPSTSVSYCVILLYKGEPKYNGSHRKPCTKSLSET